MNIKKPPHKKWGGFINLFDFFSYIERKIKIMAKQKRVRVVYAEKFKKVVSLDLSDIESLIKENKKNIKVEIPERGKMSDNSEFISVKFIIK